MRVPNRRAHLHEDRKEADAVGLADKRPAVEQPPVAQTMPAAAPAHSFAAIGLFPEQAADPASDQAQPGQMLATVPAAPVPAPHNLLSPAQRPDTPDTIAKSSPSNNAANPQSDALTGQPQPAPQSPTDTTAAGPEAPDGPGPVQQLAEGAAASVGQTAEARLQQRSTGQIGRLQQLGQHSDQRLQASQSQQEHQIEQLQSASGQEAQDLDAAFAQQQQQAQGFAAGLLGMLGQQPEVAAQVANQQQTLLDGLQGRVQAGQATLAAEQQAHIADHAAQVSQLHQESSQWVQGKLAEGEQRIAQRTTQTQQQIQQRHSERAARAQGVLESGRQEAAGLLAEAELPLDHSYEARAASNFQGVIMRKLDESGAAAGDAAERLEQKQRRLERQQRAKEQAQQRMDQATQEADDEISQLEQDVDAILNDDGVLSETEREQIEALISTYLTEQNTAINDLEGTTNATLSADTARQIMQLNMETIQTLGDVFALVEGAHTGSDRTALDAFYNNVSANYLDTVGQSQSEDNTYYIFTPAARLDDSQMGNYDNTPFSELGAALMNEQQIDSSRVTYFQGSQGESAWDWGDDLSQYMQTIGRLNPNAQFVLGGHSSSGRAVADAAAQHAGNSSGQSAQDSNRILELLLFDPHIIYPDGQGAGDFSEEAISAIREAQIEITVFGARTQSGGPQQYPPNNAMYPEGPNYNTRVHPYPLEWGFDPRISAWNNTPTDYLSIIWLGVEDGNPHYDLVGEMGDSVSRAAEEATNRNSRVLPLNTSSDRGRTPVSVETPVPGATPSPVDTTPIPEDTTPTPYTDVPDYPVTVVNAPSPGLRLRSSPDTNSDTNIIAYLEVNTPATVLGVNGNPNATTWYYIRITSGPYAGSEGWAYSAAGMEYLRPQ
ncbi:MAG: hypothetical protein OHK0022_37860 [Roseiflexaceae bacterium]